jgi:hypothetical protein
VVSERAAVPTSRASTGPGLVRRLLAGAIHPATLTVVGALSLAAALFVLSNWIGAHRELWYGDWVCGAATSMSLGARRLVSIVAAVALVTLAAATSWLGLRRDHRVVAASLFWAAVATLWVAMVRMSTVATIFDLCQRLR